MDIDKGDWIRELIKDHKLAKHTANALLLYSSLESHCSRCTELHDPRHRSFSSQACIVLNGQELQDKGGVPTVQVHLLCNAAHAHKKILLENKPEMF
jgi:hypothetical protein